jgi:predicted HAD superfamily Cof-like phosphohydrolase
MDEFHDVGEFHGRFGLPVATEDYGPRDVPGELLALRVHQLFEEADEFAKAAQDKDQAGMADALVDIVYFALGTAHVLGVPWHAVWSEIHAANMRKVRSSAPRSAHRGGGWDVVKPDDFIPPDVAGVLARHGWPTAEEATHAH